MLKLASWDSKHRNFGDEFLEFLVTFLPDLQQALFEPSSKPAARHSI
jgi:hypothetical protein